MLNGSGICKSFSIHLKFCYLYWNGEYLSYPFIKLPHSGRFPQPIIQTMLFDPGKQSLLCVKQKLRVMNSILLKMTAIFFSVNFWVSAATPKIQNNIISESLFQKRCLIIGQEEPLTKDKILKYIKSSLATFKLQNKMKSQANQSENLIQEFYKERKVLLQKHGWDIDDFEDTESRIYAAMNAMETKASLKSDADFKKEIAEVETNNYLSKKQKSETIKLLKLDRKNRKETFINPSKPDWAAVKIYKNELEHLTNYISGNRPDAPVLE